MITIALGALLLECYKFCYRKSAGVQSSLRIRGTAGLFIILLQYDTVHNLYSQMN